MQVDISEQGTGDVVAAGDTIDAHYCGMFPNG